MGFDGEASFCTCISSSWASYSKLIGTEASLGAGAGVGSGDEVIGCEISMEGVDGIEGLGDAKVDCLKGAGLDGWKGMIFLRNFLFLFVIVLDPSTLTV